MNNSLDADSVLDELNTYKSKAHIYGENAWFAEWSKKMISYFPDTPMIAEVFMNEGARTYGPFVDGAEAVQWLSRQTTSAQIHLIPLRYPYVRRTANEFYNPHTANNSQEFDHTAPRYEGLPNDN